ncbi:alpha/beta fold hydrolase [Thiohalospira sp.]|uniref:alpha/beta fold hydrolase n=1 Tax=Thiohalospira sp. TaxID=3080549 RepID=UPI00397F9366
MSRSLPPLRTLGLLLLTLLPAVGMAQGENESAVAADECLTEPVFGERLCYTEANRGAGEAVVLIHGVNGSVETDWPAIIPALAEDFHVLALDLPGFGNSGKGNHDYSPTNYADVVEFLIRERLGDKPYHVVGHSMGSAVTLRLAGRQPEGLRRIVLASTAGVLHPLALSKHQAGSWLGRLTDSRDARRFAESMTGKVLEELDRLPFSPPALATDQPGRSTMLRGEPSAISAMALSEEDFSNAIATIQRPALVLIGTDDRAVPRRTSQLLAGRLARAHLRLIPGAGHAVQREATDRFLTQVRRHLRGSASQEGEEAGPPPAAEAGELADAPVGKCRNESGRTFSGDYRRITLHQCEDVTITGARLGGLHLYESTVEVRDSRVDSADTAMTAIGSEVVATGTDIRGAIALRTDRSRLDLAGVHLFGERSAIQSRQTSHFLFSVSRLESPAYHGFIHGSRRLSEEDL